MDLWKRRRTVMNSKTTERMIEKKIEKSKKARKKRKLKMVDYYLESKLEQQSMKPLHWKREAQ